MSKRLSPGPMTEDDGFQPTDIHGALAGEPTYDERRTRLESLVMQTVASLTAENKRLRKLVEAHREIEGRCIELLVDSETLDRYPHTAKWIAAARARVAELERNE